MQLLAHVSGFVSQTVGPQKHIGGTSRFCFSIFSRRFLFKASKKLTYNSAYSLVSANLQQWQTREHSESTNLCQGQNLACYSFSRARKYMGHVVGGCCHKHKVDGREDSLSTHCLLVWPWNLLQGHQRRHHWTEQTSY